MDNSFSQIKTFFGFGCMRLPMIGSEVDIEQFKEMTDYFIENGFNYFDTAHGYIDGKSELAIKEALTKRYSRDKYLLTDKLTESFFNSEEDIRPFFQSQLDACGVEYFDFYLMHAQTAVNFEKFKKCNAYETAFKLKEEGKIKHVGLSFHDKAEVLDNILTTYPQIEIVQIQFNYVDYDDASVQSKKVYDVCRKHNKPIIVMEPVKGGSLVNLPEKAQQIFDELNAGLSNASYAIRFAASQEGIRLVLSGMSDMDQMKDNVSYMKDFKPLSETEMGAVARVTAIFKGLDMIPCTACHYCVEENHCPMSIKIPEIFACYNRKKIFNDWNQDMYYGRITSEGAGKASDCIQCGGCENVCPQHLEIRNLLKTVAAEFEK
ncbi:aldo/keto reductase [Butyrivibrio hungatei]|uniref:Oxidoreductase aldo/keto reductase family n=1 Tax=Butyrivibrio hungatei TaxID=185008 RepID=A0A1D9P598_9FIRM|nr:aldo/keto reductase [Butyrivibrio hungatei]AOZ97768.1 oxidoreductase aldo/keto reductase family [Butyrivibrio hungatei]